MQHHCAFPRGARRHGRQHLGPKNTTVAGIHNINERRADQPLAGPSAGLHKLVVHMGDRTILVQHAKYGVGLYRVAIELFRPQFRFQHIFAGVGKTCIFAQLKDQEQQRKHDQH